MKMSELNNGEKFLVEKIELTKNNENMFESLSFEIGKIYKLEDKDDNKFKIKFISNSFDTEKKLKMFIMTRFLLLVKIMLIKLELKL
jgi:hypothetical protein